MAETANNPLPVTNEDRFPKETLREQFMDWVRNELVWYAGSFSFHLLALSVLLLLPSFGGGRDQDGGTVLVSKVQEVAKESEELKPGDNVLDSIEQPPQLTIEDPVRQGIPEAAYKTGIPDSVNSLRAPRSGQAERFARTWSVTWAERGPSAPAPGWPGAGGIGPGKGGEIAGPGHGDRDAARRKGIPTMT